MISIENLVHIYPGTRKQPPRTAIGGVSLGVPQGSLCILSGPNGSGKSSLFRILCGLTVPTSGSVRIGGHDIIADPTAARQRLGVVFQSPAVDKQLSVAENLRLHGQLNGLGPALLAERQAEALIWTDLKDRLNDRVDTLSGGLARQVELAKVMLTRPEVLLLDEPTTGLDPASRRAFLSALRRLQKARGMTVLMTSHVFSEVDGADSVAIMSDGKLLAHDTPDALMALVGPEMIVIEAREPDTLAATLKNRLGLIAFRQGAELRIDTVPAEGPVALIGSILQCAGADITSIAVKKPDLEDVFVHVTGKGKATTTAQEHAA